MINERNHVTYRGYNGNVSILKKWKICQQQLSQGFAILPVVWFGLLLLMTLTAGYLLLKSWLWHSTTHHSNSTAIPIPLPTEQSSPLLTNPSTTNQSSPISSANLQYYQTLAQIPNIPQGIFKYGGSTTFAPLRSSNVISRLNQVYPGFQLRYTEPPAGEKPGSTTGIKMLLNGQLSFSQSSRPLKDTEFAQAQQRGFKLDQIPVAIDGIAFYVNPRLSVQSLTLAQIRDIFMGKIKNWQEVGGPNLKMTPFSRNVEAGGTVEFLREKVLGGQSLGTTVQEVRDTTHSIREVAKTPGGIGYATAPEVLGQNTIRPIAIAKGAKDFVSPFAEDNAAVNQSAFVDDTYPVTRRLFVIIKRDGGLDQQAGVAYTNMLLSSEGQELVEKAGFVPLH